MKNIGVYDRIMESGSNQNSSIARIIPVFIIFFGLLALYYLYQYLFGPASSNTYDLITKTQTAQSDPAKDIVFISTQIAPLHEGGEFSISTWIYISNWSYRAGFNKPILSIGGANFDTIRMYLGASTPKLMVRIHTKEGGVNVNGANNVSMNDPALVSNTSMPESLTVATFNQTFNTLQPGSGLLDNSHLCDIPELDLQRWINITVAVNGKTVDVYLDGKLSRSCVLPNSFKVDTAYSAKLLQNGGFGGQISTTTMHDIALNPEQVYRNYMAGPMPINSFTAMIGSFFPNINISVSSL
jgi:hypothetical protein